MSKANLGEGLYTWGTRAQAEAYQKFWATRYGAQVEILEASIGEAEYQGLRTFDVRSLGDAAQEAWMEEFSLYGKGTPHGFDHVIRGTGNFGPEYFFSKDVFHLFTLK